MTTPQERAILKEKGEQEVARDYKVEERLRSGLVESVNEGIALRLIGEEARTKTDRISKEGAYVSVPVETLERVRELIDEWYGGSHASFVIKAIAYELFLENKEGIDFYEWEYTTKQEGGK